MDDEGGRSSGSKQRRAMRGVAFSAIALLAFLADTLSKGWAEQTLAGRPPIEVIGDTFQLDLGYNTGIAFGIFANGGAAVLIASGLVIVVLSAWVIRALWRSPGPALPLSPIGLILGGAAANFVDRFGDGRVTDFLDIGAGTLRWPTFNLADSAIVFGLSLLAFAVWTDEHRDPPRAEPIE